MQRGADIVAEAGKRQLSSARPAADGLVRFQDEDGFSRARQNDCSRQAVRPRADDDSIERWHSVVISHLHNAAPMCQTYGRAGLAQR